MLYCGGSGDDRTLLKGFVRNLVIYVRGLVLCSLLYNQEGQKQDV
jgi:hypothetical protein